MNDSFAVWIDTTAPAVTSPVYTNATQYKNTQSLTYNVSVIDAGVGASYCRINVASATASNVTVAVSSGWCNGTYSLAGATDGNKTIYIYANDTLGNTAMNDSFAVWIDTTTPVVTLPVYTNRTHRLNTQTITLNVSVIDAGVGASYCRINANGTNQTTAVSSGWCNGTYWLTNLADGNNTINVYANDSLGNTALNNSFAVSIDTTAPIINETNMTDLATASTATITWSTDEAANRSVNYGTTDAMGTVSENTSLETTGYVTFASLSSDTYYYYNTTSCDAAGSCNTTGPYGFRTDAGSSGGSGDSGSSSTGSTEPPAPDMPTTVDQALGTL
jgi:hypothetical protein